MPITACIFDAYGTLFDVGSAAQRAADEPGNAALRDCWAKLAEDWRLKQLQYTWLRTISKAHVDFRVVTQDGLDWAMEAAGLGQDIRLRDRLLKLYEELSAYPEVPNVLRTLKDSGLRTAILSNGAPDMLDSAVRSAGIGDDLDAVLSVEEVGTYKPSKEVYDMVGARFGIEPDEVLFISSNGWDAAGAAGYGFETVWVNRAGDPMDRLPWKPQHVLDDLTGVPNLASAS